MYRPLERIRRTGPGEAGKKLIGFAAWLSGVGRQSCSDCRKTHQAGNKRWRFEKEEPKKVDPPCEECRPSLDPENATAVRIYDLCGDEWMIGPNRDRIAIPGPAIEVAMNILGISNRKERQDLFMQVKTISRTIAREDRAELKRIRESQQKDQE